MTHSCSASFFCQLFASLLTHRLDAGWMACWFCSCLFVLFISYQLLGCCCHWPNRPLRPVVMAPLSLCAHAIPFMLPAELNVNQVDTRKRQWFSQQPGKGAAHLPAGHAAAWPRRTQQQQLMRLTPRPPHCALMHSCKSSRAQKQRRRRIADCAPSSCPHGPPCRQGGLRLDRSHEQFPALSRSIPVARRLGHAAHIGAAHASSPAALPVPRIGGWSACSCNAHRRSRHSKHLTTAARRRSPPQGPFRTLALPPPLASAPPAGHGRRPCSPAASPRTAA